jgi:outer membrane protein OmpA-like peptidoglycan-associated protein
VTRGGAVRPPGNGRSPPRVALPGFPVVIEFARGRVAPRAESLSDLHRVGEWLSRNADELVTVVGHANQRSDDRAAAGLARARVATVVDLLVLLGAARSQLVPLRATRLHSVPVGSTLGERRQRRVVVVHHHPPTVGVLTKAVRALTGVR